MNKKMLIGAAVSVAALTTIASISYGQSAEPQAPTTARSVPIGQDIAGLRNANQAPSAGLSTTLCPSVT